MKTKVVSKWSGGDLAWQVWHKYLYALSIPSLFFFIYENKQCRKAHTCFLASDLLFSMCLFPPLSGGCLYISNDTSSGKKSRKIKPHFFLPYNDNSLSLFMCSLSVESK